MQQQRYFQDQSAGGGKRERTRSALLDATVSVVAEKGMEAAKISDITTAAGLANGTFYNHFNDKDEILRAAAYGIGVEVARRLDEDMTGIDDAAQRVVTATSRFISLLVKERDWLRSSWAAQSFCRTRARICTDIYATIWNAAWRRGNLSSR